MSPGLGQLGHTLDDTEDLYEYPSGDLTPDGFNHHRDDGVVNFEFRLVSPIEFHLKTSRNCHQLIEEITKEDSKLRGAFRMESHKSFVIQVVHYSFILTKIKHWHRESAITATYNQFDANLIHILKANVNKNDRILTFFSSKNKKELIASLDYDKHYEKTLKLMSENKLFDKLLDNQLIAFYMSVIRDGKCILADKFGKTLSAITIMTYFKKDWPLVIVCHKDRKEALWEDLLISWEGWNLFRTNVVSSVKDIYVYPQPFHDILIMDYELFDEVKDTVSFLCLNIKAYIFEDQTRGSKGKVTRQWRGLSKFTNNLKNAKRIIFIWSSNFDLMQPRQRIKLWPLLNILDPNVYNDYEMFTHKYCSDSNSEDDGSGRDLSEHLRAVHELQIILRSTFVIRDNTH